MARGDDLRHAELYKALKSRNTDEVVGLCKEFKDGPLQEVTIQKDTVLHVAAYTMQAELVLALLAGLPAHHPKLIHQNAVGNTILHEAAAFNRLIPATKKMLELQPKLLTIPNNYGETPLFRAVRYGRTPMFTFLDKKVQEMFSLEEDRKPFYRKKNNTTLLHTAIISSHFELSYVIAKKHEYLIDKRDAHKMTALQHLARNSAAFRSRGRKFLKRLIYNCVPRTFTAVIDEATPRWTVPLWESIQKEKQTYELAVRLADFLIERDTSWKHTHAVEESEDSIRMNGEGVEMELHIQEGEGKEAEGNPHVHAEAEVKAESTGKEMERNISVHEDPPSGNSKKVERTHTRDADQTPLFLATKFGCLDIVEKILEVYPQAVDHVDSHGQTILHIAIKYRQMEVYDMVKKMEIPMRRLIQKLDKSLNSVMHMVAEVGEDRNVVDKSPIPAFQLQEDLLLFESIKKECSERFFTHVNSKGNTAEQQFAKNNEANHSEAKDWMKRTAENCSIVAVLIATVAFAAAYTIPGGSNDQTGVPILLNNPLFVMFTVGVVLSLTLTLTSLVVFLSILTSPFRGWRTSGALCHRCCCWESLCSYYR